MIEQKPRKQLKIDKHLPQIILPPKTRSMFVEWWNKDIRFEQTIPHSFESGYMILEDKSLSQEESQKILDWNSMYISQVAKEFKTTYRKAESMVREYIELMSKITIYFKFVNDNTMMTEVYDKSDKLFFTMDFAVGDSEPEPEINPVSLYYITEMVSGSQDYNDYVKNILCLLVTALWYIATTKSTKYIYENHTPVITSRHRNVVNVSDTKTIKTPIYDLNKARVVKVEHLQTRKKGWTYSHSFAVHGHYRHYKNGKTIFINSYVKGKDKDFKAQSIVLEPQGE